MNAPQPINQVLLRIDSAFQEEIITDSGLKLYFDPTYRKEQNVSVIATIVALPLKVNPKHKYIYDSLKAGDEIAMSYRVVADFEFQSDAKRFMQTTEDNPHIKEYINARGEWVKAYALPGKISKIWVGIYQDRNRNIIDGMQGSEAQMERWLAQFPLGKTDIYTFNNLFSYKGKNYWKCDVDDIFAKKVKGHWVAVGDRTICKPIDEIVPDSILVGELKGQDVKIRYQDRGKILTGGKRKGLKKDEVVSFNPRYLEKYSFENKEYYLINEQLINGTWGKN